MFLAFGYVVLVHGFVESLELMKAIIGDLGGRGGFLVAGGEGFVEIEADQFDLILRTLCRCRK
jgi:hypothetical protein